MAKTGTYTKIATTTLTSSALSVTFGTGSPLSGNIPSTYTDLVLVVHARPANNGENINLQFNGDTGTNYSITQLVGNGSAAVATSGRLSNYNYMRTTDNLPNTVSYSPIIANIQDYNNSTTYKTVLSRGSGSVWVTAIAGVWRSTAAITSIKVICSDGTVNMLTGSTFTLYGIEAYK